MKNNINKKIGATLLAAAIMTGTAIIPMSNAAVEEAANKPLIKYQAHVQDHGWMEYKENGQTAGTTGESRRIEALRITLENCENVTLNIKAHIQDYGDREFTVTAADAEKIVGTQFEARRMEAITINAIGLKELGYKLQYKVHVQDYGWQDWKNEGEMAGTMYEAKRLEAIEIRLVVVDSEELVAAKEKALAEISKYNEIIPNVEGLTAYDKSMLNTRIATAIANIENARTAEEIEKIKDALTNLIETNYGLELAKAEAITEIKVYLDGASEGLTSYIKEKIEEINEIEEANKANIGTIKSETITECRAIITAQEYANEVFDIYSKTLNDVEGLLASEKTVIRSRISEDRVNVAKAESATAISNIVNSFETYMKGDTRYAEIVKSAEKAIETVTAENTLKTAINNKISEFEAYIEETYKDDEEGMKLAKEYKGEYIEKLKAVKKVSEIDEKYNDLKTKLDNKITDTKKYTSAYNDAVAKLKNFERIVPTLGLSNEKEIITYVEQTKAIVLEAKTATEIQTAMSRFEAYMESFEIDFDAELDIDEVKQTATTSKKALNAYVNSNIAKVSQLAKIAIEEIDEIMEDEETATVEAIEKVLKDAIAEIDSERLYAAQSEAYNKLNEYTKSENGEVIEEATKGMNAITAVTVGKDVEEAIKKVNDELAKALREINKILGTVTTDAKEAFNKAKAEIIAELREYRNMATELGDTAAIRKVNEYIDVITDMTYEADFTIEDLDAKKSIFENDMESSKAVKNKVVAIRNLKDEMEKENSYVAEKAQINSVINKAIASIKAVKAPADAEDKVEEEKLMIDEIVGEVTKLQSAYTELDSLRNTKIETLMGDREAAEVEEKIKIDNKIAEIKAIILDLASDDNYGLELAKEKVNEIFSAN